MTQLYQPPWWGRNAHLQSLLATFKLRRPFVERRAKNLLSVSEEVIIDTMDEHGEEVHLQGFYSPHHSPDKGLVILIHGWEGSANSMYLLSAADSLFKAGYSIFRLNLRDHGESHHLNVDLFHSCRLQEVVNATKNIQDVYKPAKLFMAGFSLGGNFCLRVAAESVDNGIQLQKVVAICPPIDPYDTMIQLRQGVWIYDWYFQRKWKRSLRKKVEHFPEKYKLDTFNHLKDLGEMTDVLLADFGDFNSTREYFDSYALKGKRLENLQVQSVMILAEDDPIIRHSGSDDIEASSKLKIIKTKYGGHCGHLKNSQLHSWADEFIIKAFAEAE